MKPNAAIIIPLLAFPLLLIGMAPLHKGLFEAAKKGNAREATALLKQGAVVTAASASGMTPLHLAAFYGREMEARLLLDKGAVVTAASASGMTPLHLAAGGGHEAVVRLLLQRGAAVNKADNNGHTPLHEATGRRHAAVVRLLLAEKGARDDSKNTSVAVPLRSYAGGTVTGTVIYTGKTEKKKFSFRRNPNAKFCPKIGTDGHKPNLVKGDNRILKTVKVGKDDGLTATVVAVRDIEDYVWMDGYKGTEVVIRFCEFLPYTGVVVNEQYFHVENADADPDDPKSVKGVPHSSHAFEVKGVEYKGYSSEGDAREYLQWEGWTIFNRMLPEKGSTIDMKVILRREDQGSFILLKCDQHEWELAFFLPVKNPYYAMTGADGRFTIEHVPAGKHRVLAWHPFAGQVEAEVEVKEGATVTANFQIKP